MTTLIQLRRGWKNTAVEGLKKIPDDYILQKGEPCFEADTQKLKIGDGITPYIDLPYIGDDSFDVIDGGEEKM